MREWATPTTQGRHPKRSACGTASALQYEAAVDAALDAVADTLSAAVDLDVLFGAARRPSMATGPTA